MKHKPIEYAIFDYGAWFRVFGFGLHVADRSKREALYSERVGLRKVWRVGRFAVKVLKP